MGSRYQLETVTVIYTYNTKAHTQYTHILYMNLATILFLTL